MEERQNPTSQAEQPTQDFNHRAYQWIKKHPLPALLMAGVAVAVLVIAYWAFWPASAPEEAGFVYTVPAPEQELYRTLWDWLELLIVPLAVASGAAFISFVQKRTELDIADQARKTEQQITTNRLRQATLEAYYDRMTELLLEYDLRASADYSEARSIARARTVAVVRGLDGERNRQLFAFLRTSQLIEKDMPIVDLRKADLSGAELSMVPLHDANLIGANLVRADLRWADLSQTDLSGADLFVADVSGSYLSQTDLSLTNLSKANLSEAIMFGANLSGANLSKANLSEANLTGAMLFRADLSGADLSGADLSGANLSWARLKEVRNWTHDEFDMAETLEGATMPDGVELGGPNRVGPTYEEWKAQYLAKQSSG